MKRRPGTAK